MILERTCALETCRQKFAPTRNTKKYCSLRCQRRAATIKHLAREKKALEERHSLDPLYFS